MWAEGGAASSSRSSSPTSPPRRCPPRTPTCASTCSRTALVSAARAQSSRGVFGYPARTSSIRADGPYPVRAASRKRAWGCARPWRRAAASASVDKFPRMTDYVIPRASGSRMRTASASAPTSPGTTVMHEGFVQLQRGHARRLHDRGTGQPRASSSARAPMSAPARRSRGRCPAAARGRSCRQRQPDRRERWRRHFAGQRLHRRSGPLCDARDQVAISRRLYVSRRGSRASPASCSGATARPAPSRYMRSVTRSHSTARCTRTSKHPRAPEPAPQSLLERPGRQLHDEGRTARKRWFCQLGSGPVRPADRGRSAGPRRRA